MDKIAKLPQVERILDKGYEILYCTEDVDDFVMQALGEIDGKKFKSATAEDALPQTEEEKKASEEKAEAGKPVLEAVKEALGDKVKEVRISKILKTGACCLSADGPVSLEMERYMRKLEGGEHMKAERVLELNADSAPYAALKKAVDEGDKETVEKYSKLLYGQALLLAELPLEDPAEYAQLVCSLMCKRAFDGVLIAASAGDSSAAGAARGAEFTFAPQEIQWVPTKACFCGPDPAEYAQLACSLMV